MIKIILSVALSSTIVSANINLPSCKKKVQALCSQWISNKNPILKTFSDGSVIPNYVFLRQLYRKEISSGNLRILKKSMTPSSAQEEKIRLLFKELSRSSNRGEIKLKYFEPSNNQCESLLPYAEYDANQNTVRVCKAGLNLPLESLVPVLAHEIGHSMDPCTLVIYNYKPQFMEAIKIKDLAPLQECRIDKNTSEHFAKEALEDIDAGATGIVLSAASRRIIERLLVCGQLEKTTSNSVEVTLAESSACDMLHRESFADQKGAEITSNYLQTHAQKFRDRAAEVLSYFEINACLRGDIPDSNYPTANERLRTFTKKKKIQNAIGCVD